MTVENTSGPSVSIEMDFSTISETNRAPAIGALYADAIPAAAPHATISRRRGEGHFRKRPTSDAIRAESCTIGPSRPIEPPEAIEKAAEKHRTRLERIERRPFPSTTASM